VLLAGPFLTAREHPAFPAGSSQHRAIPHPTFAIEVMFWGQSSESAIGQELHGTDLNLSQVL
jgi:hypothetical protein